jgi:hypothetical protein
MERFGPMHMPDTTPMPTSAVLSTLIVIRFSTRPPP